MRLSEEDIKRVRAFITENVPAYNLDDSKEGVLIRMLSAAVDHLTLSHSQLDRDITQLRASLSRYEKFAQRYVSRHHLKGGRWPCPECGRNEGEPLRLIGIAQANGSERPTKVSTWSGCMRCNDEDLISLALQVTQPTPRAEDK